MSSDNSASVVLGDREVLQALLAFHAQYHNHKENAAFSIFGLEGAFFIGIFVLSQWPPHLQKVSSYQLAIVLTIVWSLFHFALRFQLRNRRIAAILVASYYDALTQSAPIEFKSGDFKVGLVMPRDELLDLYVVPVRGTLREPDVEAATPESGNLVHSRTLKAFYYHLAKHKALAATSWTKYAYPIDLLASLGSIFLLVLALARTFNSPVIKAVAFAL